MLPQPDELVGHVGVVADGLPVVPCWPDTEPFRTEPPSDATQGDGRSVSIHLSCPREPEVKSGLEMGLTVHDAILHVDVHFGVHRNAKVLPRDFAQLGNRVSFKVCSLHMAFLARY